MKSKPVKSIKPSRKPRAEKIVRLSITLPNEVYRWLKTTSARLKLSMSAIVRSIITSALIREMKANPGLLKKGETVEKLEQRWEHQILPEFDLRSAEKPLSDSLKASMKAKI